MLISGEVVSVGPSTSSSISVVVGNEHLWDQGSLSVRQRGEDCTKSRTDELTREEFTQVRAAWMRNTLLLLDCIICVLGQFWELQYFSGYACRMGLQRVDPPPQYALGLLLYEKGATTGGVRDKE